MDRGAVYEESGSGRSVRDIVVLLAAQWFDFIGSGLDPGRFDIRFRILRVSLDDTGVIKEELVAPACAKLAFAKHVPNLRRGAVDVVRVGFDDDRHFVRSVTFE